MPTYDGMRALVTGGGSGIGAATARLLREGARRWPAWTSTPPARRRAVSGSIGDVSDPGVAARRRRRRSPMLGGLDVLVNNAGVGAAGTVEDSDDDVFRRLHEVNVLGTVRVTRAALPALRALVVRGGGEHLLGRRRRSGCRSGRRTARARARCSR